MKIITKTVLVASLSIAAVFGSTVVSAHSDNTINANEIKVNVFNPVQNTQVNDGPIFGESVCANYPQC
jgi:hypothetical protein